MCICGLFVFLLCYDLFVFTWRRTKGPHKLVTSNENTTNKRKLRLSETRIMNCASLLIYPAVSLKRTSFISKKRKKNDFPSKLDFKGLELYLSKDLFSLMFLGPINTITFVKKHCGVFYMPITLAI